MRFKDKVTIVTGGASGMGKSHAQGFAKEGSTVIILDRLEEKAISVAKGIESQGGKAVAITVDATDGQQVKDAVEKIAKKWGRIDILINNIGTTETVPFLETDEALWRETLDFNLLVPMRFCRAVLPYMVNQRYGRIVNIASIAGRQPRPLAVDYSAAKAGVIAITRSLAVAMAPYNIRVNCVCPGITDTDLSKRVDPRHLEPIAKATAIGRIAKPEEITAAVLFLASDEASYVLGQSISVDGGNCML
jgi:NAD(P)-dependent dehydrogenase (short-subunit alcohol dehydrogenase family)